VTQDFQRWMDSHDAVLCELLCPMVLFLHKASTRLPLLPHDWEPQRDILLQQVVWEEVRRHLLACSGPC
jgi:hypothetical protein